MTQLSIVIPVYNEEESLAELQAWISQVMEPSGLSYELVYVDDGSSDGSWSIIQDLSRKGICVKAVRFFRNYGKSAALDTGFARTSGEVVITMDADLQDSPEEIPELYRMIKEDGFDLVSGWKRKRYDPLSKTLPSRFFNRVTRLLSGIKLHDFNCGLKAYDQKVVKNIHIYGEMHRYIPLIAKWNGFSRIGEKEVAHRPRKYGSTKFGLERFVHGFLDLISVSFVNRYRKNPMHFFGLLGTLSFVSGLFITVWLIFEKIRGLRLGLHVREITSQPLFFLALVALIVGVQLFLTGFLAEMMTSSTAQKSDYNIEEEINAGS
ncbi:Glycosyltransferase involved in cell wall bisynthesis [Cyclobacterium lianum]|uniref:Glycosyltransferase involved in cell wall bisynthesis n=1 Tax=Cyclobacterium lianum TaxID=388280 RepID=A0A1M7P9A5_9BACT|nr:glycosyltransferase family 2 protein [Cyclobacterium lianum]SHN13283.1 Glycosyltransferase involved in cell wall bisynthesis [Cyclobacterium lianum]